MCKLIFFFKILLFFFSSIVYSSSLEKVVFINIDYVIGESIVGKSIMDDLNSINKKNIEVLKTKENELKKLEQEIKTKKNIISEKELNDKVVFFRKNLKIYQDLKKKNENDLLSERNNQMNDLIKKITPIVEEYMKMNEINIILDSKKVFIGKKTNDISNDILRLIDAKIK